MTINLIHDTHHLAAGAHYVEARYEHDGHLGETVTFEVDDASDLDMLSDALAEQPGDLFDWKLFEVVRPCSDTDADDFGEVRQRAGYTRRYGWQRVA